MVFIRTKQIKGRCYYYLVKSVRKDRRIKQITLEYLGTKIPAKNEIEKLKEKYKDIKT